MKSRLNTLGIYLCFLCCAMFISCDSRKSLGAVVLVVSGSIQEQQVMSALSEKKIHYGIVSDIGVTEISVRSVDKEITIKIISDLKIDEQKIVIINSDNKFGRIPKG